MPAGLLILMPVYTVRQVLQLVRFPDDRFGPRFSIAVALVIRCCHPAPSNRFKAVKPTFSQRRGWLLRTPAAYRANLSRSLGE